MSTITAPSTQVLDWTGTGHVSTALVESTGTEVWVTEVGGARLVRVPTAAIGGLSWTDPLDGPVTVDLVVDRGWRLDDDSWLAHHLRPIRPEAPLREVQVVHDGEVVAWGPPLTNRRRIGGGSLAVKVADCTWWMGRRLLPGPDPSWGREWLTNAKFSAGLDGWFVEWGSPSVTDGVLDLEGGTVLQQVHFPFEGTWRCRWTARIWVASSVPDDMVVMRLDAPGRVQGPAVSKTVRAGVLNRDQYQTVVVEWDLTNTASQTGRKTIFRFDADGLGPGDVLVDETSVQVSAESLGVDLADVRARVWRSQQQAFFEVIHACADFGLQPAADGAGRPVETPWLARKDVYASEAIRQITAAGDAEVDVLRTLDVRIPTLRLPLRGVEHDPAELTLVLAPEGGNVVAAEDWESGITDPSSEWVVIGESGFAGTYTDGARYGGARLQSVEAAPTGTANSELNARARRNGQTAAEKQDDLSLRIPKSLPVRTGDRVWLIVDDEPDSYDGWVRVTSTTRNPRQSWFTATVTRWGGD